MTLKDNNTKDIYLYILYLCIYIPMDFIRNYALKCAHISNKIHNIKKINVSKIYKQTFLIRLVQVNFQKFYMYSLEPNLLINFEYRM